MVVIHSPPVLGTAAGSGGGAKREAGASGSVSDKLTVSSTGYVYSSGGNITLKAGDAILLASGSIVDAAGGTITVSSQLGAGATFTVCLPQLPAPPQTSSTPDKGSS